MTKKGYLNSYFDDNELANMLDELPLWSAPFGLKLLDYINYKPNISALDIGFGTGFPLTEIAMRLGEDSIVYGIEPWQGVINRTSKKIEFYGINNIKIIKGVAESIPLENESLDLISSNNGINNVKDIDKVLSECFRTLKVGGQFLLTMNTNLSMFEFYNALKSVLSDMGMIKQIDLMYQHIEEKRPSIPRFISKLEEKGFVINNLIQDQFNYYFANGTAMLNHYFFRLAFMDSWKKLLPNDCIEKVFDRVETKLNEQAHQLGRLTISIPYVLIDAIKKD